MANSFYTKSANPPANSLSSSSQIRTEFANIAAGFDKMPTLGSASLGVKVHSSGAYLHGSSWNTPVFSWTPSITFATPGNVSVDYFNRVAVWAGLGPFVFVYVYLILNSITHSTASGELRITGLPVDSVAGTNDVYMGGLTVTDVNTVYTMLSLYNDAATYLKISKTAHNTAASFIDTSNITSGATGMAFAGSIVYRRANF